MYERMFIAYVENTMANDEPRSRNKNNMLNESRISHKEIFVAKHRVGWARVHEQIPSRVENLEK